MALVPWSGGHALASLAQRERINVRVRCDVCNVLLSLRRNLQTLTHATSLLSSLSVRAASFLFLLFFFPQPLCLLAAAQLLLLQTSPTVRLCLAGQQERQELKEADVNAVITVTTNFEERNPRNAVVVESLPDLVSLP